MVFWPQSGERVHSDEAFAEIIANYPGGALARRDRRRIVGAEDSLGRHAAGQIVRSRAAATSGGRVGQPYPNGDGYLVVDLIELRRRPRLSARPCTGPRRSRRRAVAPRQWVASVGADAARGLSRRDRPRSGRTPIPLAHHRRAMPDRPRFYLTTAIAYPNNKPGLHTLYEVIGADVIARWHRMKGDDTRFLTGTDEHWSTSPRAPPRWAATPRLRRRDGRAVHHGRGRPADRPDRFIRTTDPDHRRAGQEMVRRAYANGDIYLGKYEGWYCPNEGFKAPSDLHETATGMRCPNHPNVPLQWLIERNWFFRLSAYRDRLLAHFEANPDWVQPEYRRNEMLGFIRQGLEDISISRETFHWGIPFPIAENGETAQREDGSWDPEAGVIYVWFDALINYITGAGFPDDPDAFAPLVAGRPPRHRQGHRAVPHDHLAGDAMSAGLEPPRKVWVHGWLLAAGASG